MDVTRILQCLSDKVMLKNPKWWSVICAFVLLVDKHEKVMGNIEGGRSFQDQRQQFAAVVNITYKDPITGELRSEIKDQGVSYGKSSPSDPESGLVVHVRTQDNKTHACTPPINVPPKEKWIALVERGECKFNHKIENTSIVRNASAVVVYDNGANSEFLVMDHKIKVVAIFVSREYGKKIADLVDNGTKVYMQIAGKHSPIDSPAFNRTSILFVSISFIVLMIISLAWLVFYYIQRFRYAHAKERLSKRLMNAAKKAVSKMPLRTIKSGDKEVDSDLDQCAVCIESYRVSDVLRILPCRHMFHKSCVDPWLIEQRSCPMCKLDILKAYGLQIHASLESVANIDVEGPSTSLGVSDLLLGDTHRDIEIQAVEIIRYQPDNPPITSTTQPADVYGSTTVDIETSNVDLKSAGVIDRQHSVDANSCHNDESEKQSLLPKQNERACSKNKVGNFDERERGTKTDVDTNIKENNEDSVEICES